VKIYVTVEGIDKEIADLREFGAKAHEKLKDLVATSADAIALKAALAAPVSTGALRGSMAVRFSESGLTAFIGPRRRYGTFQEYGTGASGLAHTFVSMKDTSDTTPLRHRIPMGFPSVKMLARWAKRHKLSPFIVARAIWRRQGLKPQPFTEPAGAAVVPGFVSGVEKILEDQAAEFNAKQR
jgi:hypothetical protein